jgi:ketosteroid isomerase-like protein
VGELAGSVLAALRAVLRAALRAVLLAVLLTTASLGACAPKGSAKHAYVADRTAQAELMDADRAFAEDTGDRGIDGWLDAFAEDGVELPVGEPIAKGKAAIRAVVMGLLSDPTNKLRWEPESASVSASGDLGYTLGHAVVSKVGPSGGEAVLAKLKYVTVWKRQPDGHWRVAVEVGTADP